MNSSSTDFDVIIVGAGPAGGMCALELSKNDISVLIIEKERLPRYKTCAGGLTKKAYEILPKDYLSLVENDTYRVNLTLNHRWGFSKVAAFPIVKMVMRDKLDYFLVKKAEHCGARIIDKTVITSIVEQSDCIHVSTESKNFRSKLIVGADGINGCVARSLGLRKRPICGVALEGEVTPRHNLAQLNGFNGSLHLDFNVIPKGYGWVFPKKEHLSVGVFTTLPQMRDIRRHFTSYLKQKGLADDYQTESLKGHQIPIGGKKQEILNSTRGILIGDAAGLADPITGEGIYFALRSGQIAAEAIRSFINNRNPSLDAYTEKVNSEIIEDFRYAGYLSTLLYNLSFLSYNLARKVNRINESFVNVIAGEKRYKDLFKRPMNT
jgi:geranylgeranyl reductase family protein